MTYSQGSMEYIMVKFNICEFPVSVLIDSFIICL